MIVEASNRVGKSRFLLLLSAPSPVFMPTLQGFVTTRIMVVIASENSL